MPKKYQHKYQEQQQNTINNLLNGNIPKTIVNMSFSIALGFICLFTFNIIDTFFVAQLGSDQLAALSFTFPITFLWMNIFFGLNTGITTIIAKSIGKNLTYNLTTTTVNTLILTIIISLVISLIGYLNINTIFKFLGASPTILNYINQYMPIWYIFFIFLAITTTCGAIIRGQGDTKTPSKILFATGLLHGILDPILIFGIGPMPRLEIYGAIIATILSWVFAAIMSILYLINKTNLLNIKLITVNNLKNNFKNNFKINSKNILNIAIPAILTNLINPISSSIILKIVALNGIAAVAAFGVGMRLEVLAILFSISLSMAIVPFASINHGAQNYHRIHNGVKFTIILTLILQSVIYLLLFIFAKYIANWFSNDPNIINLIILYLKIIPGAYCFIGIIMVILSTLNAIEHAKYSTLINIIRFFGLTIPLVYLGQYLYGITGILISIVIAKILAFIVAIVIYYYIKKL